MFVQRRVTPSTAPRGHPPPSCNCTTAHTDPRSPCTSKKMATPRPFLISEPRIVSQARNKASEKHAQSQHRTSRRLTRHPFSRTGIVAHAQHKASTNSVTAWNGVKKKQMPDGTRFEVGVSPISGQHSRPSQPSEPDVGWCGALRACLKTRILVLRWNKIISR